MQIDLIPSLRRGWVSDYSFESELLNASAHQQLWVKDRLAHFKWAIWMMDSFLLNNISCQKYKKDYKLCLTWAFDHGLKSLDRFSAVVTTIWTFGWLSIICPVIHFSFFSNISFGMFFLQVTFDFNFFLRRSNVENENHHRSSDP